MKENNNRFISLRFSFPLITVSVLAAVIAIVFALNASQLENFAVNNKQTRLRETAELVKITAADNFSKETFSVLENKLRTSNIDIIILDNVYETPVVLYATDLNQGRIISKLLDIYENEKYDVGDHIEVFEKTEEYVMLSLFQNDEAGYQLDCVGSCGDAMRFIMTTPMESIRDSVQISSRFLLIIGLAAIIIGGIIMYIATAKLTDPILRLSEISDHMADLSFDVRYDGHDSNEIGVLGRNMNHLSDSLQETVTNLRAANEKLESDLREKEQLDEMRRLFLSNVSHELKTPIALIQGYAEGLTEGIADDPDSTRYYCEVIADEAGKMNEIVKRLLSLDAIESGKMQITYSDFDLCELIRGIGESSRKLAAEKDVRLEFDLPEELQVHADEFMIEGVLQNYFSNAWHYVSDPGTVTAYYRDVYGRARIYIRNTGSCIPEEHIQHIWDKFYKIDKARTRAYGGSGIGLSIVKAIMKTHNSRCGVRNTEDGVEFWFEVERTRSSGDDGYDSEYGTLE
ncbi:MAG: HAMP domain-containing protein [Lachnospiraceae bacterium]|nr:HAMP domain-containing protein [Lachnospiraceae bacterium]